MPWEQGSGLPAAETGYAWRPPNGKSALFACTVGGNGFLVSGFHGRLRLRMGRRISQGNSPIEIVVASSINAAVENVTAEIPGPRGIADQWREAVAEVDYFTATAREVTGEGAWALMAAVLGNSANRSAFVTSFWYGGRRKGQRTGVGLLDILKTAPQVTDWRSAVSDFRRSRAEVQSLSAERRMVAAQVNHLMPDRSTRAAAAAAVRETAAARVRAQGRRPALAAANDTADRRQAQANATACAYQDTRPGLFASRASKRTWNQGRDEHAREVRQAAAEAVTARESLAALDREIAAALRAERQASGDPDKPGSRRFAREAPNLLNVAVTRATRRLYVIGNHETWGRERYFSALNDPAILTYYRPRGGAG